jgi:hypothetical protein
LGYATLAGGILVVLFWVAYFTNSIDLGQHDVIVGAFEGAFPVADAAFAAVLFASAWTLLKGKPGGAFLLVVAGAMSLYLGLLDVTFYARQGHYWPMSGEAVVGIIVNVLCIGGGLLALWHGWKFFARAARVSALQATERRRESRQRHSRERSHPIAARLASTTNEKLHARILFESGAW